MAKTITLKYDARCKQCGAHLPSGTEARYYKRGFIYGLSCHEDTRNTRRRWNQQEPLRLNQQMPIVLHEGPDGVWTTDDSGNIIHQYE